MTRELALLVLGVVLLPGCAAWSDYNDDTRKVRRDFERGDFSSALERLQDEVDNELDGLCFTLERATIAQAGGNYELSQREFERAERAIEKFEDRGLSPGGAAQYAGSILVNEKTIPYQGEAFERILVPVLNCRNYLLRGQLEDAMVEVRKTYFEQERARQLHEKELDAAKEKAQESRADTAQIPGVKSQVDYPATALSSPESIYEVTYAHYLSALVAERQGNFDDARISLEAVSKIRPDVGFIRTDLARIRRLVGDDGGASGSLPGKTEGSVALLFDCGWAPHKKELKVVFPTYRSLGAIAIPIYERTANPATHARLVLGDRTYATQVLTDVDAIAFKYHKDKLGLTILKQAIRLAVKIAAGEATAFGVKQAVRGGGGKHGRGREAGAEIAGWAAGLAVGVYNIASEQADLRAWLTLPQTFQAVRAWAPPGVYPARVELIGVGGQVLSTVDLGPIQIGQGKLGFVVARSVGGFLYALQQPGLAPARASTRRR